MERVLITGGHGFIGAWIARRLLAEGIPTTLFDLSLDDHILAQVLPGDRLPRLDRVQGDVADEGALESALLESGARHVIHLAGLQVPGCRASPVDGARVNLIGSLRVFEAARRLAPRVLSVVYASSAAVAGPVGDYDAAIGDDARHHPRTCYGVFKAATEAAARVYWQDHGVPSVGLRPLAVYGVGREIGITSGPTLAIRAAVRGEPFTVPFRGVTGFHYVEDVAEDFVECARRVREGAHALNMRGEVHDVDEFLRVVEAEVPGSAGRLSSSGEPLPLAWDFRESGLESLLGSVPHTPIREGIRRTAERFRRGPDDPSG